MRLPPPTHPRRSAHDALQVLLDETWRGRRWVVETDIANCFEAIPHSDLMQAVEERVCDRNLLRLLRAFLHAGVMQAGTVRKGVTGTPQGGVVSPLLANVYLHRLDRSWDTRAHGVWVRYADDGLVLCRSRQQAEAALARLTELLAALGLTPHPDKTRIIELKVGGEGFDFLGFHQRLVQARGRTGRSRVVFLARWPSRRADQHARDRIRALTVRRRLLVPVELVVGEINLFLRGWAGYFRYGNSARSFDKIMAYANERMSLFVGKRYKRGRRFGFSMLLRSGNRLGLIDLHGTVVAPRPDRPWRAPTERRR